MSEKPPEGEGDDDDLIDKPEDEADVFGKKPRKKNIVPEFERKERVGDFDIDHLEPGGKLFPPPPGHELNQEQFNGDPYKGPFEITYQQNVGEKKCIFYLTSYWWKWRNDEKDKNGKIDGVTSIPVFWAASEGQKSETIPITLTLPETNEQPKELEEYWKNCVIKVGYAAIGATEKAHQFLVVLPDNMNIYQKHFLDHVEASRVLTWFKKGATMGVESGAKEIAKYASAAASAGVIAGGIGVAAVGTGGVALAAIPVGLAVGIVVKSAVMKLNGVIGDRLHKVPFGGTEAGTRAIGLQAKENSINIDNYIQGKTPHHVWEDRSATIRERIGDLEYTMGDIVAAISKIEESMAQHMIRTRERKENFETKMSAGRNQLGTRKDTKGEDHFWS